LLFDHDDRREPLNELLSRVLRLSLSRTGPEMKQSNAENQGGEKARCNAASVTSARVLRYRKTSVCLMLEWRRQLQLGLPLDLAQRTSHLRTVEQ
jgi:hypothetical protein